MKLSTEDVDLFYKLMLRLQFYVSRKRQMLSKIASVEVYAALPMADKIPVRDSLWENPELTSHPWMGAARAGARGER